MSENDQYFSVKRVAALFDCSTRTVRRWLAEGQLPYEKVGGLVRIKKSDANTFYRKRTDSPQNITTGGVPMEPTLTLELYVPDNIQPDDVTWETTAAAVSDPRITGSSEHGHAISWWEVKVVVADLRFFLCKESLENLSAFVEAQSGALEFSGRTDEEATEDADEDLLEKGLQCLTIPIWRSASGNVSLLPPEEPEVEPED